MTPGVRVDLRTSSGRVALDTPALRLGALARVALERLGARVVVGGEAPGTAHDVAVSWPLQHDQLLRDLADVPALADPVRGGDIVLADDGPLDGAGPGDVPVLWATPARSGRAAVRAALTLTTADARRLGESGVLAAPLLAWPRPQDLLDAPRRVLIAVAEDVGPDRVGAVRDAVASVLPGRPVVDVVPDVVLLLDDVRHAPLHPWRRSRVARSSDLVLVLGRSAGADLVAAEAALAGAPCWRLTDGGAAAADPWLASLLGALDDGTGLAPIDPGGDAESLHLPLPTLAGWLVDVSGPATNHREEES